MSVTLMSLAFKTKMQSSKKLVLLVLCDFANDDGHDVFPSISNIARNASIGERQTQIILRQLEAEGFIAVQANHAGGAPGSTRRYSINVDRLFSESCFTRRVNPDSQTGESRFTGAENARVNPDSPTGESRFTGEPKTGESRFTRRVNPDSQTGESRFTQPTSNHHLTTSDGGASQKANAPLPSTAPEKIDFYLGEANEGTISKRAALPISSDFDPPDEWGEYAGKLGFSQHEALSELEKFIAYYTVGKGAGKRRTTRGWRQAWSNWLEIANKRRS